MFNRKFTFRILWHIASKLNSEEKTSRRSENSYPCMSFLWVKLAQVLNVPRIWDILALRVL
jgi:hypothetical protein